MTYEWLNHINMNWKRFVFVLLITLHVNLVFGFDQHEQFTRLQHNFKNSDAFPLHFSYAYPHVQPNVPFELYLNPPNQETLLIQINNLIHEKKWDEVIVRYEELIEKRPNNIDNMMQLGTLYTSLDRHKEAIDLYGRILTLRADHPEAMLALAYAHLAHYNLGSSEELFKKIVQNDPNNVNALSNLGRIAALCGNLSLSEKYYQQALTLDPTHTMTQNYLGMLLFDQKKYPQARKIFAQMHLNDPHNMDIKEKLIRASEGEEQELAMNELQLRKLKFDIKDMINEKKWDEAILYSQQLIDQAPNEIENRMQLGHLYLSLDRKQEAIEVYEAILQLQPTHQEAMMALANIQLSYFNLGFSENLFKKILLDHPTNPQALEGLKKIESLIGRMQFDEKKVDDKKVEETRVIEKHVELVPLAEVEKIPSKKEEQLKIEPEIVQNENANKKYETASIVNSQNKRMMTTLAFQRVNEQHPIYAPKEEMLFYPIENDQETPLFQSFESIPYEEESNQIDAPLIAPIHKDPSWNLNIKVGNLFPLSKRMRKLYSSSIPFYQLEAVYHFCNGWGVWGGLNYASKDGHANIKPIESLSHCCCDDRRCADIIGQLDFKNHTRFHLFQFEMGLNYKWAIPCIHSTLCLGAGLTYSNCSIKNESDFIKKNVHKNSVGGVVKTALIYPVCHSIHADVFLDYSGIAFKGHTRFDCSSLRYGIGLGVSF